MFLAQHTKARLALEISCQSQPAHSSAGWDMAATDHIYKRGKTTQTQSRKAPQLGKEPVTFSRSTKSLPTGFVFQHRPQLQSCVGEGRNRCPWGCCEEHTSEQLLALLSNLNFNWGFLLLPRVPGSLGVLLPGQPAPACPHMSAPQRPSAATTCPHCVLGLLCRLDTGWATRMLCASSLLSLSL